MTKDSKLSRSADSARGGMDKTMAKEIRALDLFCKAGGVSVGLWNAGFDVVGVDIEPQPHYPSLLDFHQADALTFPLDGYDFIWASPPCQRYTQMLNHGLTDRANHPDLVDPIRQRLIASGKPYVIENVAGAPIRHDLMLCGEMFGLRVMRHRYFECSFPVAQPYHPPHDKRGARRKDGDGGYYLRVYGHETGKREWGDAMGISWMTSPELAQAIPPAYADYIADQFIQSLESRQHRKQLSEFPAENDSDTATSGVNTLQGT